MSKELFAKLFPVGTEKVFVDRVLVNAGKAHPEHLPDHVGKRPNAFSYYWESPFWGDWFFPNTWNITVIYNSDNKVVDITLPIGRPSGESVYSFFSDCKIGESYGRNWK